MPAKQRVCVLGGGPAGYPAAFFAADAGFEVTLVDEEAAPGGVCLYRGCIPSKTLLHAAKVIHEAREATAIGLSFGAPALDLDRLRAFSQGVVGKLTGGLGGLARKRGIRFVQGRGELTEPHALRVRRRDGSEETIAFDWLILATGSQPNRPPGLPSSPRIMDSTSALALPEVPAKLLVVGGGYIGLELATVYSSLGSEVTIIEASPHLLRGADRDLVAQLEPRLRKLVHELHVGTRLVECVASDDGVEVQLLGLDLPEPRRRFDRILIAVGRHPSSSGLGLEHTGVQVDARGFIVTDAQRRTAERHIFAVGDVAGEPMLAHKATYEARIAVEAIAGKPARFDAQAIPAVVFTDPEIAWCGLTESDARERGVEHEVSRFPWSASGRAATMGRSDGLTKLISDPRSGKLLGVGIAGAGAAELIAEGVLALEMGALVDDVQMVIHAHPTLSETMLEAAELFHGASAHWMK